MRCKTFLVALLVLAFQAQAARVSESEAASAASVWAGAGRALGVRLGSKVRAVREYAVTNGYSFYAVKMDGGMAIMSSDTQFEPVVAFSPNGELNLSEGSPALDLLRKDIALRAALAGMSAASSPSATASAGPTGAAAAHGRLWSALMGSSASGAGRSSRMAASEKPLVSVEDVRVSPFVKSKWSQTYAGSIETADYLCYNYYTPKNYPCGCTATATAQIMRYFQFPTADIAPASYDCMVGKSTVSLTTQGGFYDWANMTLVPKDGATDEERKAIGKLTSDVGIVLKSQYSKGLTSALPTDVAAALRDAFGYFDAACYWSDDEFDARKFGLHEHSLRERVVLANLDAGQPVLLAIYGYAAGHVGNDSYWAGHAVVADGYGYQEVGGVNTEYVHINMGWAGTDDMWYNIPEINAANSGAHVGDSGHTFVYMGGATFNISPNASDAGLSILSGRVTDDEGVVVPGAKVRVFDENDAQVGETTVDENGIYVFRLEGDKGYSLFAESPDGKLVAELDESVLPATKAPDSPYIVSVESNVGNSWGNDMEIAYPSVRVGGAVYTSVDRAVAAAREAAVPGTPVMIEILEPTKLRRSVTIDFDCVLFSTNASAYATPVKRVSDAQFTIAPGFSMLVSNVVFSAGSGTVVDVGDGGVLKLVGTVDFGVEYDEAAVHTMNADGFLLLGGIGPGFTLHCEAATGEDAEFGHGQATDVAAFDAMCASAVHIANFCDPLGERRGVVQGSSPLYSLKWRTQAVPFEDCTGYFVDATGKTNTAARIDRLFDFYAEALSAGRIVDERCMYILRRGTLSRLFYVADGLSLVGSGVDVTLEPTAGFTHAGGVLSVSGLSFHGYKGNALFHVVGDGAALYLGPDVAFTDFEGTNKWSGAVAVLRGSATATGVTFENCRATASGSTTKNSFGGAFYMASGTSLTLEDVTITGCYARNYGGGVYADVGVVVSLAGALDISGNRSGTGNSEKDDDLYLRNTANGQAALRLHGVVTGSVGVRWEGAANGYGNDSGLFLAAVASPAIAHASAAAFFCDSSAELSAEPDDPSFGLRWTETPTGPQPWHGSPDDASARVEYTNGTTEYYLLVSEALEAVAGDATIYITGWNGTEISSNVVVSHTITLASDRNFGLFGLLRVADCSIVVGKGASLTLRDIGVYGSDTYSAVVYGETITVPMLYAASPLFDVCGGSLLLDTPSDLASSCTEVGDVYGGIGINGSPGARNSGAVCVWQGGKFHMRSGAEMFSCCNSYQNAADGTGRGGAVMVDDGEAIFEGGKISDCMAYSGGGVFVGNQGTVSVSGDTQIVGNYDLFNNANNLVVHDLGKKLTLAGKLTGSIGYTEGSSGDKVVFGNVAAGVSESDAQSSAHNFTHDVTGAVGMAVSGPSGMLLVWSDGLDAEGKYAAADGSYALVSGEPVKVAAPSAVALVYSGEEQTGVADGMGFAVSGGSGTNAGDYTATATLKAGFEWDDGTTSAKTVDWSIAKAAYDMSGISFDDRTVAYGGQYVVLEISGDLPDGVTVDYVNNRQIDVGVYTATAFFIGDATNYEAIPDMTATLTIFDDPAVPPSESDPAQPVPIAFSAIDGAAGQWTLSITTAVEKCWYSLYETNSLLGGFGIDGVAPVELRQASSADAPTMIFTRPSGGVQLFWKVLAEPENAH